LERLAELLFRYRVEVQNADDAQAAGLLLKDLLKLEGRKIPNFLKPYAYENGVSNKSGNQDKLSAQGQNKRQQRHV
jgi:hypothetical protein